jgi:hypothetical protein
LARKQDLLGGRGAVRLYMETELVYTADHAVDIQGFFDRVMEEFLTLRVDDPGIGVDLQRREVSIGLVAQGEGFEDAVAAGMNAIRTAIHAAGGATPGWLGPEFSGRLTTVPVEEPEPERGDEEFLVDA